MDSDCPCKLKGLDGEERWCRGGEVLTMTVGRSGLCQHSCSFGDTEIDSLGVTCR